MPTPGLLFVVSKVIDSNKTSDETYDRWYNDEHVPEILNFMKESGFSSPLALRYKNINPGSSRPYLALYPNPDAQWMLGPGREKFLSKVRNSEILGGDFFDYIEIRPRHYEKIQTFEGYGHVEKTGEERGQTLVCVAMEPAADEEQDFEDWYRKQHLDMLSMCRGYRRTTRYKRLDNVKPRYLALHEYACKPDELPSDQIKQVSETEWTKKILAEAETFDRDVFELIQVQGEAKAKL